MARRRRSKAVLLKGLGLPSQVRMRTDSILQGAEAGNARRGNPCPRPTASKLWASHCCGRVKAESWGLSVGLAAKASAAPGNGSRLRWTVPSRKTPAGRAMSGYQKAYGEPSWSCILAQGAEPGVGPEAGGPLRDQAKLRFRARGGPRAWSPGQDPCERAGSHPERRRLMEPQHRGRG